MQTSQPRRRGGAATDLLVAAPLVAMLGVVTVKTFTDAEINTKVAQVREDMRAAAVALETYHADWGLYPFDGYNAINFGKYNYWYLPVDLSTPVAYLDSVAIIDPFRQPTMENPPEYFSYIRYVNTESTWGTEWGALQTTPRATPAPFYTAMLEDIGEWMLLSVGPDGLWGPSATGELPWETPSGYPNHSQPYDPTNGANSLGDIIHSHINEWGYVNVSPTTTVKDWQQY